MPPPTARARSWRDSQGRIRVISNDRNVGFAAAQNQAIAASARRLGAGPESGCAAAARLRRSNWWKRGRLDDQGRDGVRPPAVLRPGSQAARPSRCIDSAGIYFTPAMRHFDRGWHEPDDGRFRADGIRVRRQRRRGSLPPRDDRRRFGSATTSSTPTSSPIARTRMSPGAPNCSDGAVSMFRMRWAITCEASDPAIGAPCRPFSTCTR